jgi:hypothetical protein
MDKNYKYDTRWGFHTEADLFRYIWETQPHYSYISGIPIREPSPANFAHVLSKALNRHPHFRLNPNNIILATMEEHSLIDQGTVLTRERYCKRIKSASFKPFYQKQEGLIREYNSLFDT